MTESELVEATTSYFELTAEMLGFYMTVTSAYLIVAYLAGVKLLRSQVILISALYTFMASFSIYTMYAWGMRGVDYGLKQAALVPDLQVYASPILPAAISALLMAGMLASLKFMWDVRHPKPD